jgi:acyl dehydratase
MVTQLSQPADLLALVGQDIGTGQWHAITQHQVNIFADATHDHQWIHVEPERAAKGPYGGPIAHGYLTLSFCPVFLDDVLMIDAVTAAVNYGVNRVRFPAPVPVGSRIRGHVRLVSALQKPAGLECAFGIHVELEGSDRPACVIETLVIYR